MIIYFAGTTGIEIRERLVQRMTASRLLSYYYMDKGLAHSYGLELIKKGKDENLSSGRRPKVLP